MPIQINVPDLEDPRTTHLTAPQCKKIASEGVLNLYKKSKLSLRAFKFIVIYAAIGFSNATRAYQMAGYATKNRGSATAGASELLSASETQVALRAYLDDIVEPFKARVEGKLMDAYWRRAFYDPLTFIDGDNASRPLGEIDEKWRCVIDGTETRYYGKDADRKVIVYKLANRAEALTTLARYVEWIKGESVIPVMPMSEARERMGAWFEKTAAAGGSNGNGKLHLVEDTPSNGSNGSNGKRG